MSNKESAIMRFCDWHEAQCFGESDSFHEVADEVEFLQNVIYPMYYKGIEANDIPYIIGNHNHWRDTTIISKYESPIYLIENENLKVIFLVNSNHISHTLIWEVSFLIKKHSFCDEKIIHFRNWYREYYQKNMSNCETFNVVVEELEKVHRYNGLTLYANLSKEEENFTISFEGKIAKFMFFELMNHFRKY